MAKNRAFANARKNYYPVASGVVSGDPVVVGADLPGVALTDRDATGYASVDTGGAYSLEIDGSATVAPGDILYFFAPGTINAASSGVRFGYAMAAASGVQTIPVKLGY
jgi:predicted RecA/RadA family phage recombinase